MNWMLLVLFYGVMKGCREVTKKLSLQKNTALEVLLYYTFISFLMVIPQAPKAMGVSPAQYGWIALKSFIIFVAWICSFYAIKRLPISLYGVLDLSRVLFATLLGVLVLGESMGMPQIVGLMLVCAGLIFLKVFDRKKEGDPQNRRTQWIFVLLAFLSCMLNAVSGLMDKILMKDLNSSQLQFWYMLFLLLYYVLYFVFTRTKIQVKTLVKNYWVYLLSIMFVLADKALFIANADPDSKVTVMTLIKQSGVIVTILGGKMIFREEKTLQRLLCAGVIIAGILVAVWV